MNVYLKALHGYIDNRIITMLPKFHKAPVSSFDIYPYGRYKLIGQLAEIGLINIKDARIYLTSKFRKAEREYNTVKRNLRRYAKTFEPVKHFKYLTISYDDDSGYEVEAYLESVRTPFGIISIETRFLIDSDGQIDDKIWVSFTKYVGDHGSYCTLRSFKVSELLDVRKLLTLYQLTKTEKIPWKAVIKEPQKS